MILLFTRDFKLGTDFKGGLEAEVAFAQDQGISSIRSKIFSDQVRGELEKIVSKENTYIIRMPLIADDSIGTEDYLKDKLADNFSDYTIDQVQVIGGVLSSQNRDNAIYLSLVVILLIMGYLSFRFKFYYGVTAIIAIIHDVLITLFFVTVFNLEVNILVIVAILTIFGYSVNDTIVLFDRIREMISKQKGKIEDLKALVNQSVNQIFSRTVITSLTTLLVVFSLYVSTEGGYKEFSLLLIIGIISGTYSSVYIACSAMLFWNEKRPFINK